MPHEGHAHHDEPRDTRLEALTDGVFAIVMTLLVLELHVPAAAEAADSAALLGALAHDWPDYAAYATSFLVLLILWVNHRNLVRILAEPDVPFLFLNGLLLLLISLSPFTTALLAEHFRAEGASVGGAVYAGVWVITAIVYNVWWHYASRDRRLIATNVPDEHVRAITRQYRIAPPLYGLAFLLAFVHAGASLALIAALAVFYAVTASTTKEHRVRPRAHT